MTTLQEGIASSHALSEIDRVLCECSSGERSISNAAVLDVRVFLTARATMSSREVSAEEERSFAVFQQMVHELRPKVIVSCQRGTFNARNVFVRQLCSRFPPPANRSHLQVLDQRVPAYYDEILDNAVDCRSSTSGLSESLPGCSLLIQPAPQY